MYSVFTTNLSLSLAFYSDRPSAWCKDNWIHWRALKSAFSVETQLREILLRLQQVQYSSLQSCCERCLLPTSVFYSNNCNKPLCRLLLSGLLLSQLFLTAVIISFMIRATLFFPFQKRDFPVETFDGKKSELFRRCLCTGYFTNVARRYHQGSFDTVHI